MPKSASFDVLGTCFHFTPLITLISKIIHRTHPTTPIDPPTLFASWFYAAQRDFTYLSLASRYTPIATVLRSTFRRSLHIVGFPDPDTNVTEEDLDAIAGQLKDLPAREGLKECFEELRGAGVEVFAVTNGGREASLGYFRAAGVPLDSEHLISCDDIGVAKPDMRVYERANEVLEGMGCEKVDGGSGEGARWFVAAHSWDLVAAREAGFRTAWVGHEEGDAVQSVFGEFEVVEGGLKGVAGRILGRK